MDNQACRKRDLELWQVLEPNRNIQRKIRVRTNKKALKRRKARQRKKRIYRCITVVTLFSLCVVLGFLVKFLYQNMQEGMHIGGKVPDDLEEVIFGENAQEYAVPKPNMQEDFLSISEYNRPGTKLTSVRNIFVHYTANPGTTAAQNRSYFEGLGETHERAASAHFIIGCEGEIIQCIPLDEEAYAVIGRNNDSISIECCYVNEDGSFTQATYDSLIHMLAWLVHEYDLDTWDILRHYDSSEKRCPLYYVEHEDEWENLRHDVERYLMKKYGKSVDTQTDL